MKSHFHRGNFFCHNFFMPHEFWLLLNVILLCKIHKIQFKQLKKEVTIIFLVWYGRVRERGLYYTWEKRSVRWTTAKDNKVQFRWAVDTVKKLRKKKTCSLRASYHNIFFITCTNYYFSIFSLLFCRRPTKIDKNVFCNLHIEELWILPFVLVCRCHLIGLLKLRF